MYFASPKIGLPKYEKATRAARRYGASRKALQLALEVKEAMRVAADYDHLNARPLLPKVRCPALVIQGLQDGVITPKMSRIVKAGISGAKLVELDACGHYPFIEQPEKTTDAILKFVRGA